VKTKQLTQHLRVDRYGNFLLTDAIRPSLDLQIIPSEGFRIDTYRDPKQKIVVPVLASAVSRERLYPLFMDLLDPLGDVVDVILESSHNSHGNDHDDLHREHIELPILKSHLWDFEDLLTNAGCTGIAVVSNLGPMEDQFDEHKLLVVYAQDLEPFERVFYQHDIDRNDRLKLITEGEHLHSTDQRFMNAFEQLSYRLGTASPAERVSW
jgi:hypothetical protein